MKFLKRYFLPCVLVALIPMIAACSDRSGVTRLNASWGLNLPSSVDKIYSYSDVGWFGDGIYYYVYSVDSDDLNINFAIADDEQTAQIVALYENQFSAVEEEYYINAENVLLYYYQQENGGNDYIYLVYDKDLSYLFCMEYHS